MINKSCPFCGSDESEIVEDDGNYADMMEIMQI